MAHHEAVGITDEPTTMPVERGKIRGFARACLDDNPEHAGTATFAVP